MTVEYLYIRSPDDMSIGQCFDYEIEGKKYHLQATGNRVKGDWCFAKILQLPPCFSPFVYEELSITTQVTLSDKDRDLLK